MAFKSVKEIRNEKNAGKFTLDGNGDFADVIFLYRSEDEVMSASVHYVSNAEYTGNVQCTEMGCPFCAKGYKPRTKVYVPVYVLSKNGVPVNEFQFWERNMKFSHVLSEAVFKFYANPSEYVFRITREGSYGDPNTKYKINVAGTNRALPFDKICSDQQITFPEVYNRAAKEVDNATLMRWAAIPAAENTASGAVPEYVPTPRVTVNAIPEYNGGSLDNVLAQPEDVPFDIGEFPDDSGDDVDFG